MKSQWLAAGLKALLALVLLLVYAFETVGVFLIGGIIKLATRKP